MFRRPFRKLLIGGFGVALMVSGAGCTPSSDTVSSLVDLAATTSGSFVEIIIKDLLNLLVTPAQDPNLNAPISEQQH
jgi:hypothetical protein